MNIRKATTTLLIGAAFSMLVPSQAHARTKTVLKYGAIGLGAAALYNLGQRSAYSSYGYSGSPYYGASYGYGYAPQYHHYPAYGYGGYYGGGHFGGGCGYY